MAKRKALSKAVRFTVLVRDGHRCRYCGAGAADVALVIDHIIPVVQGGTNDPENLLTACQPCNAGKGARTPSDAAPTSTDAARIERSIREQATLADAIRTATERRQDARQAVCNLYCTIRGVQEVDGATLATLTRYAEQHGTVQLANWLEIAAKRLDPETTDEDFGRYVSGIRRNQRQRIFDPETGESYLI